MDEITYSTRSLEQSLTMAKVSLHCILNKTGTESKMENPTQSQRDEPLASAHIAVATSRKKKRVSAKRQCRLYCLKEFFSTFAFYLNVQYVNTLAEYTYFYISKRNITSYTFLLVFKIVVRLQGCVFAWLQHQDFIN